MKILVCFGTRPEAVKMAPLCKELERRRIQFKICVTAQHREMLDQVLHFFKLSSDYDLDLMQDRQSLNKLSSRIFSEIDEVFNDFQPDVVMVQGDTTTAFCIAMAAFYQQIKVAHVEAGLRTYERSAPYPEEINRQVISRIADFHFAPTKRAAQHLLNEKIPGDKILITGNTVIDALELAVSKLEGYTEVQFDNLLLKLPTSKRMILVTGHRRENFGKGLINICNALLELADEDIQIVYPVHLNPQVKEPVIKILGDHPNILLPGPLNYPVFLELMRRSSLIISDSGGIQEEAPFFHKTVLVTREFTERSEGLESGFSFLVGTDSDLIVKKTKEILANPIDYENVSNPYGDGRAAIKIIEALSKKWAK